MCISHLRLKKSAIKRLKEINIKWQRAWFSNLDSNNKTQKTKDFKMCALSTSPGISGVKLHLRTGS
jgi:hypothetical protein